MTQSHNLSNVCSRIFGTTRKNLETININRLVTVAITILNLSTHVPAQLGYVGKALQHAVTKLLVGYIFLKNFNTVLTQIFILTLTGL